MAEEPRRAGLLRRLAMGDEGTFESVFVGESTDIDAAVLGDKTRAVVRLAALIATEALSPSYQWVVTTARAAGVREDELIGVLVTVGPIVGVARVASAAPALALALGFDLDLAHPA